MSSIPPSSPPTALPARVRRWLPRLRPHDQTGGVNISGTGTVNIAGDLVAGDKIVNIGRLEVPVRFFVAFIVLAAVIALGVWWIVTPGQMPAGSANVAIVEFGARDVNGRVTNSGQGTYLSQWLYNRMSDSLADLPANARPVFWHLATGFDLAHLFQKREIGGPIGNDTEAEKVARDFNARIVIYGNLDANQDPSSFTPQFYVSQLQGEADELSGSQQLGQPIPIPTPVNDEYLEQTLQPIGRALVWFSRALNNDLNGRYDLAYQVLKQGEGQLADWNEDQGKEVYYYFIGREALFLASCEGDARIVFAPQNNSSAADLALNAAQDNFTRAQGIAQRNGRTYARATFGLGQVALQRAQHLVIPSNVDTGGQCRINLPDSPVPCSQTGAAPVPPENLVKASEWVGQAVTLLDRAKGELPAPAPANLEGRIRGARASADILAGTLALFENRAPDAATNFARGVDALLDLTRITPATDKRTLANAYAQLGSAYSGLGVTKLRQQDAVGGKTELQNGLNAYAACTKMISPGEPDAFLRLQLARSCECAAKNAQKVLEDAR